MTDPFAAAEVDYPALLCEAPNETLEAVIAYLSAELPYI